MILEKTLSFCWLWTSQTVQFVVMFWSRLCREDSVVCQFLQQDQALQACRGVITAWTRTNKIKFSNLPKDFLFKGTKVSKVKNLWINDYNLYQIRNKKLEITSLWAYFILIQLSQRKFIVFFNTKLISQNIFSKENIVHALTLWISACESFCPTQKWKTRWWKAF